MSDDARSRFRIEFELQGIENRAAELRAELYEKCPHLRPPKALNEFRLFHPENHKPGTKGWFGECSFSGCENTPVVSRWCWGGDPEKTFANRAICAEHLTAYPHLWDRLAALVATL